MTTKKELREALQRLADTMQLCMSRDVTTSAIALRAAELEKARAILARPAVVVGYRVRVQAYTLITLYAGHTYGASTDFLPATLEWCLAHCRKVAKKRGGTVRKLVRR